MGGRFTFQVVTVLLIFYSILRVVLGVIMRNVSDLYKQIWLEKRERDPIDKPYPLGINVTCGQPLWSANVVIDKLLQLLKSDPRQGLEWSSNWGRTVVTIHPKRDFSVRFSLIDSQDEKLSTFLTTQDILDPSSLIDPSSNKGYIRALINNQPVRYEGIILLIERMVDESVWCRYLTLKQQAANSTRLVDQFGLYKQAVNEIYRVGIAIVPCSEANILDLKRTNPTLPVRMYGNILNNEVIPKVIGAVILPEVFPQTKGSRAVYPSYGPKPIPIHNISLKWRRQDKKGPVCIGICLAKELHVGHLFHVGWADTIRRVIQSNRVFLESNDYGPRIFGMVAGLAATRRESAEEVTRELCSENIPIADIVNHYRHRREEIAFSASAWDKLHSGQSVLEAIHKETMKMLHDAGFSEIELIPDSSCFPHADRICSILSSGWSLLGFDVMKYRKGGTQGMIVLKHGGHYTASVLRSAFVDRVMTKLDERTQPVFVDANISVKQAKNILATTSGRDLIVTDGCGVGFNFKIASGTGGESLLAREAINIIRSMQAYKFHAREIPGFLTYFVLTRYENMPAHKRHLLSKASRQGESFFDYFNNNCMVADIESCAKEYHSFRYDIDKCLGLISSWKRTLVDTVEFEGLDKLEFETFMVFLRKILNSSDFQLLFPRPKEPYINARFRQIRDWMIQKYWDELNGGVDKILVKALVRGCLTVGDISKYLMGEGIIRKELPGKHGDEVECFYIKNLHARGYPYNLIVHYVPLYLSGKYILQRKQCAYFNALVKIMRYINDAKAMPKSIAAELGSAIKKIALFLNFAAT